MAPSIDLNPHLGEGFGAWRVGDDRSMLDLVTSANVACGGHAGDPETMCETLTMARERAVVVGAHPGFAVRRRGLDVDSEIFADRGHLPTGRLVPRSQPGAMIEDDGEGADRIMSFLGTRLMPTVGGPASPLDVHSICVHGASDGAVAVARHVRGALAAAGATPSPFLAIQAR
jgi:lactam utilization protein B